MAPISIWTGSPPDNLPLVQPPHHRVDQLQHGVGVHEVTQWLRVFIAPGTVVELRALDVPRPRLDLSINMGGYYDYDHLEIMATDALDLSGHARGVHFTLNPLNPDLIARSCNQVKPLRRGETTTDADVTTRRWLLIDLDPARLGGISSTETEKQLAYDRMVAVRDYLRDQGWPAGISADSGNGFHLLYRIDLPKESPVVQKVLRALDERFSDDQVKIDTKVYNPARIVRLYGTMACKGDSTADRPHRTSRVLEVPSELKPVDPVLLARLAGQAPTVPSNVEKTNGRIKVPLSEVQQRAQHYLAKMAPAISGQHGHNQTYEAACRLVQGFGLSVVEAMPLLREYNARCQPPWSNEELLHKLEDAARIASPDGRGYLLNSDPRPKVGEPLRRSELPPLDGRPFIGEIPDFVLSPTSSLLGQLPGNLISPERGRPSVDVGHLLQSMRLLAAWQQEESPYVIPDVFLSQFLHGAIPSKRWRESFKAGDTRLFTTEQCITRRRKEITRLRHRLRRRGGSITLQDRIAELQKGCEHLSAYLGGSHDNRRSRCPSKCPLRDSDIPHQHYKMNPLPALARASFGCLFEEADGGVVRFDSDRRNEENQLVRHRLISENMIHWAYLPIEVFGQAAGLCRREMRLVQGFVRERTRRNRGSSYYPGRDRLEYVDGGIVPSVRGSERVQCPLLTPEGRYVVFGGNRKGRRARGYPIVGRERTGWLRRAGYPTDGDLPIGRLWEYAGLLLDDLRSLSEPFHLTAALLGRDRQWRSLDEAIQMLRRPEGRRWLERACLRIYAPDNHLAIWRRWLAGRLGFGYIPGGEWTLPPNAPPERHEESEAGSSRLSPRLHTPEAVRAWLKQHGMNQAELAKRIGWSPGRVNHQLTGRTGWSADFQHAVEELDGDMSLKTERSM